MNHITVVNAVIYNEDNHILAVKKGNFFILPGGKPEAGETDKETLVRELHEELGVSVQKSIHLKTFYFDTAVHDDSAIEMRTYIVTIHGVPTPAAEITECLWLDKKKSNDRDDVPSKWWDEVFAVLELS